MGQGRREGGGIAPWLLGVIGAHARRGHTLFVDDMIESTVCAFLVCRLRFVIINSPQNVAAILCYAVYNMCKCEQLYC